MMWGEVEGILSAQQVTVSVVQVLLDVISPVVIVVFNLYRKTGKRVLDTNESSAQRT